MASSIDTAAIQRRALIAGAAGLALAASVSPATAQTWPGKPLRLVAPFAPGGAVDIAARIVAEKLQPILGHPVVVDNKGGAGAMIGTEIVARSAPDGLTLLLTSNSLINSPVLFGRAPYDWRTDFAFITTILTQPMVLVAHPSVPANSFAELIALAKREGSKLSMATPSAGTINHLAGEMLAQRTGARWEMVHYKGSGPANSDLLAGQVHILFDQLASTLPHLKAGKLRALAVSTAERASQLPDVPTIAESGVAGFDAVTLFGLSAPAKTPPAALAILGAAMQTVLADPAVVKRFDDMGATVRPSTPEAFRAALVAQADMWVPVIQKANIRLE